MPDLTETTISSDEVYDGALLHAFRDEVELPGGGRSVREWLDHPGASAVVPLLGDGQTVLVRQFRYPARRAFLEVPAGKLDVPGEDPEAVARRELEEETGWKAGRLTPLASSYPCIGYSNETIHLFLAEDLTRGTMELGEGEHLEVVPLAFDEAVARARRGELADMKTALALLLADAHLRARGDDPGRVPRAAPSPGDAELHSKNGR